MTSAAADSATWLQPSTYEDPESACRYFRIVKIPTLRQLLSVLKPADKVVVWIQEPICCISHQFVRMPTAKNHNNVNLKSATGRLYELQLGICSTEEGMSLTEQQTWLAESRGLLGMGLECLLSLKNDGISTIDFDNYKFSPQGTVALGVTLQDEGNPLKHLLFSGFMPHFRKEDMEVAVSGSSLTLDPEGGFTRDDQEALVAALCSRHRNSLFSLFDKHGVLGSLGIRVLVVHQVQFCVLEISASALREKRACAMMLSMPVQSLIVSSLSMRHGWVEVEDIQYHSCASFYESLAVAEGPENIHVIFHEGEVSSASVAQLLLSPRLRSLKWGQVDSDFLTGLRNNVGLRQLSVYCEGEFLDSFVTCLISHAAIKRISIRCSDCSDLVMVQQSRRLVKSNSNILSLELPWKYMSEIRPLLWRNYRYRFRVFFNGDGRTMMPSIMEQCPRYGVSILFVYIQEHHKEFVDQD